MYDKLRTARLNVKYYSVRLDRLEQISRVLEITLLVSAPSSAIAGIWLFTTDVGKIAWQSLGVLSAVIATVRPAFQLTKKTKEYESAITAYRMLEYDLETIRQKVEQRGAYDARLKAEFLKALARQEKADLVSPDKVPNAKLRAKCTREVLAEMPPNSFFVPET